jgi:branched-chain amino acid transport system permease protein
MSNVGTAALGIVRHRGFRPLWYPLGLVLALFVVRLAVHTPSGLYLVALMAVYAIAALGLNVMFGMGGMLSLAQAATMAVGGYTSALSVTRLGLPFLLSMLVGAMCAAVISAFASLTAMRVATHYFVLVTLALAETISLFLVNQETLTGGFDGLPGIPPLVIGGVDLSGPWPLAATMMAVMFLAWYVADAFRASRTGYAAVASSDDPQIAMACGISIARARLVAGTVGGVYAGIAGALFGQVLLFLGPSDFGLDKALLFLLVVVIGGLGTNVGTVVAAFALTYLSQGFLQLREIGPLVYGVGIMVILVAAPNGIAGIAQRVHQVTAGLARRRHPVEHPENAGLVNGVHR